MIILRPHNRRGHADHGWLDSWHSFSFADYYDPNEMGFSVLRVINDDTVAPGGGFATHGHQDMEIVTYVLDGALEHKDSLGNGSVIRPGDVQRMSAGPGIRHSEFNGSNEAQVHFLQIWLLPAERGIDPGYEQKHFAPEEKRDRLRIVASPDGRDGSVLIHQDARLYAGLLGPGASVAFDLPAGRKAYVHLARGKMRLNGLAMVTGDGAKIADETRLEFVAEDESEVLLFDLPA
ncbi:MAG: pirin family protein [Betaproteobacteria bacterium]|nr:pirin family protein [Betaproteobacteria bacterium]